MDNDPLALDDNPWEDDLGIWEDWVKDLEECSKRVKALRKIYPW